MAPSSAGRLAKVVAASDHARLPATIVWTLPPLGLAAALDEAAVRRMRARRTVNGGVMPRTSKRR